MTTAHIPAADGSRSSTQYTPDVSRAPTGSAGADGARRPRIAVIAVHGVGDHEPGETGNAVSGLLTGRATGGRYTGFGSEPIAIPLAALDVPRDVRPAEATAKPRRRVRERSDFFEDVRNGRAPAGALLSARDGDPSVEPLLATRTSYESYRAQLAGYKRNAQVPTVTSSNVNVLEDDAAEEDAAEANDRRYESTRWRGERAVSGEAVPAADVVVYEMYWADLSKLRSGTLAFFRAFFQLLLHIPALGRQAIDEALVEQPGAEWRWLQTWYTWAVRWLVIRVPVLSAVLLMAGLASLPATYLPRHLGEAGSAAVAIAVVVAASLALVYQVLQRGHKSRSAFRWSLVPVTTAFGSILLGATLVGMGRFHQDSSEMLVGLERFYRDPSGVLVRTCLTAEWWIAAGFAVYTGFKKYDRVRHGAYDFARFILAVATAAFVYHAFVAFAQTFGYTPAGQPGLTDVQHAELAYQTASLWTVQLAYGGFAVVWAGFYFSISLAFGAMAKCWWHNRDNGALDETARALRARARAVLRTVRLAASLAIAGFLFTTIATVGAVYQTLVKRADLFDGLQATNGPLLGSLQQWIWIPPLAPRPDQISTWLPQLAASLPIPEQTGVLPARLYVTGLFAGSTTVALPIVLALIAVCALVLLWTALPSIGYEGKSPSRCSNMKAEIGGIWLLRGMDATAYGTWTMWVAMFVVLPLASLAGGHSILSGTHANTGLATATLALLDTTGALLATSAIAAAVLLAKYGGTALDVVLDVDNYLRGYPDDETPTAQIAERYASLLRHVAAAQEAGRGYDAVVIVAHSLGTTITTDVLRTLHLQAGSPFGDPALAQFGYGPDGAPAQVPIQFFSMGCPLRQLMNRFFPHRFWWVRDFPDGGVARPKMQFDDTGTPTPPVRPDPRALGVAGWSNAYRTGDYVGRSLWLDRWFRRTENGDTKGKYPEPIAKLDDEPANVRRWEACIGLGAHTHYWDASAPDVSDHLDTLIERAVEDAAKRHAAKRHAAERPAAERVATG